jgi:hypothetical protein
MPYLRVRSRVRMRRLSAQLGMTSLLALFSSRPGRAWPCSRSCRMLRFPHWGRLQFQALDLRSWGRPFFTSPHYVQLSFVLYPCGVACKFCGRCLQTLAARARHPSAPRPGGVVCDQDTAGVPNGRASRPAHRRCRVGAVPVTCEPDALGRLAGALVSATLLTCGIRPGHGAVGGGRGAG